MNAVERLLHYSGDELPQEPDHRIASTEPTETWPTKGVVEFDRVVMSYRQGLDPVLKGMFVTSSLAYLTYSSMSIQDGEKVGIIGRTGAGKTSLTVALYRLAEYVAITPDLSDRQVNLWQNLH